MWFDGFLCATHLQLVYFWMEALANVFFSVVEHAGMFFEAETVVCVLRWRKVA